MPASRAVRSRPAVGLIGLLPAVLTALTLVATTALLIEFRTAPPLLAVGAAAVSVVTGGVALVRSRSATTRRPALLLGLLALGEAGLAFREVWYELASRAELPVTPQVSAWLRESGWWLPALVALVLAIFPDGRLPSRRWRWVPVTLLICVALGQLSGAFDASTFADPLGSLPRPYPGLAQPWSGLSVAIFIVQLGLTLACAAAPVIKFRRGDDLARTQLTWLFVVGSLVGLYPLVCLLEIAISGTTGWISGVLALLIGVGLPLAFLAATAPKTLCRADWALSAALTYGALSLLVLSAYAAGTALTGLLTSNGSAAVAAVVAAGCGVLLAPWRRRIQGPVDRRFFPRRRAVRLALADLQRRIHAGTSQPEEIEEVLRQALRDRSVRVGLRLPGELESRDLAGRPLTGESIPVLLAGQPVGALTATTFSRQDRTEPSRPELVEEQDGGPSTSSGHETRGSGEADREVVCDQWVRNVRVESRISFVCDQWVRNARVESRLEL